VQRLELYLQGAMRRTGRPELSSLRPTNEQLQEDGLLDGSAKTGRQKALQSDEVLISKPALTDGGTVSAGLCLQTASVATHEVDDCIGSHAARLSRSTTLLFYAR
jgi:hypothetical protein